MTTSDGLSRDNLLSYLLDHAAEVPPFEAARLARAGLDAVAERLGMSSTQLSARIAAYDYRDDLVCEALVELEPSAVLLELERAYADAEARGLEPDEALIERFTELRDEETGPRREALNTLLFHVIAGDSAQIETAAARLHEVWALEKTAHWLNARGL